MADDADQMGLRLRRVLAAGGLGHGWRIVDFDRRRRRRWRGWWRRVPVAGNGMRERRAGEALRERPVNSVPVRPSARVFNLGTGFRSQCGVYSVEFLPTYPQNRMLKISDQELQVGNNIASAGSFRNNE